MEEDKKKLASCVELRRNFDNGINNLGEHEFCKYFMKVLERSQFLGLQTPECTDSNILIYLRQFQS
jgi:hypothetical protein